MGKYSKALSNRMRVNRQISPFRRVSAEEIEFGRCTNQNEAEFVEYYKTKEWWINDAYIVILDKQCDNSRFVGSHLLGYPLWNMRISRQDGEKIHDWCILQEIKNKIVGEEFEALELYPARSRHMDEGNIYHLWILAPKEGDTQPPKIPVGHVQNETPIILQHVYEQMDGRQQQALKTRYKNNLIIFPNETFVFAKAIFPEDADEEVMTKYLKRHPEMFYR
jgi:hypothetical protein